MASREISVNTNPVANQYSGPDEKIIEFTTPCGGGLISICFNEAYGIANVTVYRADPTVTLQGQRLEPVFRDGDPL